jgi:hypothetical protein
LARKTYPELFYGALASSAPILPKMNYKEFYEIVGNIVKLISKDCYDQIKYATSELDEFLKSKKYVEIAKVLKLYKFYFSIKIFQILKLYLFIRISPCKPITSKEDALSLLNYNIPYTFGDLYYRDYKRVIVSKNINFRLIF